jgi:hypothetical protein
MVTWEVFTGGCGSPLLVAFASRADPPHHRLPSIVARRRAVLPSLGLGPIHADSLPVLVRDLAVLKDEVGVHFERSQPTWVY